MPNGTSAGSLTSNILQDVTVNGVTEAVNYYDEVFFSPSQGALVETTTGFDANGNLQYSTDHLHPRRQHVRPGHVLVRAEHSRFHGIRASLDD